MDREGQNRADINKIEKNFEPKFKKGARVKVKSGTAKGETLIVDHSFMNADLVRSYACIVESTEAVTAQPEDNLESYSEQS